MNARHWDHSSYLDALRPEPGWRVDRAVLTTYSADLVPIGAALLALSGAEDDGKAGSRVEFADAIEKLRGRVRVLAQAGRLAPPRRRLPIFAVFDQFVREVPFDERVHSWHPKTALVRLRASEGAAARWRLWIGSRNLTRDMSWDAGLLLVADGSGGAPVAGISGLAREWITRAGLDGWDPGQAAGELARAPWRAPNDVAVDEVILLSDDGVRRLPKTPTGSRRLTVVSPFLDSSTLKTLGAWPAERKILLSSAVELARIAQEKLGALAAFDELLALEPPASDAAVAPPGERSLEPDAQNPDSATEPRGLHAKLILAEHDTGCTLWLGSANATARGWNGLNTEVVAQLKTKASVADGIAALAALASTVRMDQLPAPTKDSAEEETLEEVRKRLAVDWPLTQERWVGGTAVMAGHAPELPDGVRLEVAPVCREPVPWPPGATRLDFTLAPGEIGELVQLRLRMGGYVCAWLQRARLDPPPAAERDHEAVASFLDPRTFLAWLRALLGEEAGEGGGPWDESSDEAPPAHGTAAAPLSVWAPTLEDILKAWRPDAPDRLRIVDDHVKKYLTFIRKRGNVATPTECKALLDFEQTWKVIAGELLP